MYDAFGLDKHLLVVKPFVAFFGKLFARRKTPAFTLESISTHSVATNPKGVRQLCARSDAASLRGARQQSRMHANFSCDMDMRGRPELEKVFSSKPTA